MTPNTELSDERIFGLAKQHFGGSGHNLIWQDDPRYAAACDMTTDARWSVSAVRAEQTLAFARAILAASPAPLREADEGSDVEHIVTRLRHQSEALRRKPTPLADLIPLLQQAADALQYGICTYWCPACYEEVKEPKHRAPSGIEADGDGGKGPSTHELLEPAAWHRDMEAWKQRDMEKRWERIEARIAELTALNADEARRSAGVVVGINNYSEFPNSEFDTSGVGVDADPVQAALEKLLRAEEKYVRDTGLPQPDDLIQDAVNEARAVLGWPAIDVPSAATPQDQAIYDSMANRYQRDRTAGVPEVAAPDYSDLIQQLRHEGRPEDPYTSVGTIGFCQEPRNELMRKAADAIEQLSRGVDVPDGGQP
jgi:hypothetical protein